MGLLSSTTSICQLKVVGDFPTKSEFKSFVSKGLQQNGFRDISQGIEEVSIGWVLLDDSCCSDFSDDECYLRGKYLALTMRIDSRRVHSGLFKREVKQECDRYKAERPGLSRVPKQAKDEIKDTVKTRLLAKTLALPATFDMVWDTDSNVITFVNLSPKTLNAFEDLFKKTFPGLRTVLITPYDRAEMVVDPQQLPLLKEMNQSGANAGTLELIADNGWLGQDFLRWLLGETLNGEVKYRIRKGKLAGTEFVAYANNKMALIGETTEGKQKVTISGPQDAWGEAKLALSSGKLVADATLIFELEDEQWLTNLKADRFYFAGFKTPRIEVEKGDCVDEAAEREAVFYEKMHLLETGTELFDSLLSEFLQQRLSNWNEASTKIDCMLA